MSTLAIMKARIADELGARTDLADPIANCISDAIVIYQKELFRFNESFTATFPTVASQQNYSAVTDANFPGLATFQQVYAIDWLHIAVGSSVTAVRREQPDQIILLNESGTQTGQPYMFAYAHERIMLHPVPDTVYTMTVAGHITYRAPQSDSEAGNRWMTDGERLIRSRAKFEMAVHYLRDSELAMMMSPDEPGPMSKAGAAYDAYESLKGEANRIVGRGVIRAMEF